MEASISRTGEATRDAVGAMAGEQAPPRVLELVNARLNGAGITATTRFLAQLTAAGPCALEIALTADRQRFLARAATPAMERRLAGAFAGVFAQGQARPVAPADDPARVAPGERVLAAALGLGGRPYLPVRILTDEELDPERGPRADPLLGLLTAAGGLPRGWRVLVQLALRPPRPGWARGYARMALERPLVHVDPGAAHRAGGDWRQLAALAGGLALLVGALQAHQLYLAGDWLRLGLGAGIAGLALPAGVAALVALRRKPVYDPELVRLKIGDPAFAAQLRLVAIAPAGVPEAALADRLWEFADVYRQYDLPAGNHFTVHGLWLPRRRAGEDWQPLLAPRPIRGGKELILSVREVAGVWHLPQAGADTPLVERTGARQRLPRPETVAAGCRIGVSRRHGRAVPVHVPDALVARQNALLVAKTRAGKSTLLVRFARHRMEEGRGCLLVLDPQRDLARDCLGVVPRGREADVVFLDAADAARPFGLNLLDAGLGWGRDQIVRNTLLIFRNEFDGYWGPRMEDCFRNAALALAEANATLCARDPGDGPRAGRARQYTVLDIPALFVEAAFRREVLELVDDPDVHDWWHTHWLKLPANLRQESANPVVTKVNKFKGTVAARRIVGQPASTIDPRAWLREGKIVIVNAGAGEIGADAAAMLGGTIINLVKEVIAGQQGLARAARDRVTLLVDEFHLMPGADYEELLSGLAKNGANVIFATQSLARLDIRTRDGGTRPLRPVVFDNIRGLFVFHTSAENAAYLVPELGGEGEVDVEDLVGLEDYRCYARISRGTERLPAFLVDLDGPPPLDAARADRLAAASAARFGRPAGEVDLMRQASLARIRGAVARAEAERRLQEGGAAPAHGGKAGTTGAPDGRGRIRGKGRGKGAPGHPPASPPYQLFMLGSPGDGDDGTRAADAGDADEAGDEGERD